MQIVEKMEGIEPLSAEDPERAQLRESYQEQGLFEESY